MTVATTIHKATSNDDIHAVKALFREYSKWLDVDICFQGFEAEMARLPESYVALLLAKSGDDPIGAVGLVEHEPGICEMKRLYLSPGARGEKLGERLAVAILEEAKAQSYTSMVLHTLPQLKAAQALYRKLGFTDARPYFDNQDTEVVFLSKEL